MTSGGVVLSGAVALRHVDVVGNCQPVVELPSQTKRFQRRTGSTIVRFAATATKKIRLK